MLTKLLPEDLEKVAEATKERLASYRLRLMLCAGTGCVSRKPCKPSWSAKASRMRWRSS